MKSDTFKNALITGIPFGLIMGLYVGSQQSAADGVTVGLLGGLAFGVLMSVFAKRQENTMASHLGLFEEEPVILEGAANHFMKAEGRGGWLTLTDTRLAFRSHGKNVQNAPVDIDLSDIASANPCMTALLIPTGLLITRKDGSTERFVVTQRNKWAQRISEGLVA